MNSSIEQASLSPERLPNESTVAYRAFCVYRDLGPERSLDRAWKRFCADQGKDRASARRPGYWAAWSRKYYWVDRASAHDDSIEEEKRRADAAQRRKLQERRSRFAVEEQERIEGRVRSTDELLNKMGTVSLNEVTRVTFDKVTGTKTTTKIMPPNLRGMAALTETRNKTATQAIQGHDIKDLETKEREVERIVWVRKKNLHPATQGHPQSGQPNREPITDLDADPKDAELDEAA